MKNGAFSVVNEGKIGMNVIRGMVQCKDNVPSKSLAVDKIICP